MGIETIVGLMIGYCLIGMIIYACSGVQRGSLDTWETHTYRSELVLITSFFWLFTLAFRLASYGWSQISMRYSSGVSSEKQALLPTGGTVEGAVDSLGGPGNVATPYTPDEVGATNPPGTDGATSLEKNGEEQRLCLADGGTAANDFTVDVNQGKNADGSADLTAYWSLIDDIATHDVNHVNTT